MKPVFRNPTNQQRLVVIGRTGSGKTRFASWMLANAPYDRQPYVIVDFKGEDLFTQIVRARDLSVKEPLPKAPGIYHMRIRPDQGDDLEAWLWKVHAKEKIGLFFDESYNIPDPIKGGALRSILTQGRSKKIACILCTQRPSWISRFIFSEADFYAVFQLNITDDKQRVSQFVPDLERRRLPDYHCQWYDVASDKSVFLSPCPSDDEILDRFDERLRPKKAFL